MSRPSKTIAPASLRELRRRSAPTSVVLPAPFGPISACTSPACDVEVDAVGGDDAAEALGQAAHFAAAPHAVIDVARPRARDAQAGDALAREQHDGEQHPAGPELPVLGSTPTSSFLKQQQHGRAEHAAPERADAAEDHHHHQRARLRPVQHVRADVALQVRRSARRRGRASAPATTKHDELVAEDRKAERLGAHLVVAEREHGAAEARRREARCSA